MSVNHIVSSDLTHISLGEFARTIIRANPFKGGTSEFAYPDGGGYDSICKVLADFILEKDGDIQTKQSVKKIIEFFHILTNRLKFVGNPLFWLKILIFS